MVHVDQLAVRSRRGWRARTFWLFPLALMLLTLVLTWTVDQLNDRRDGVRQQQLVLTEIESDFGTVEVVAPLAMAPGATDIELEELDAERGEIDAGFEELASLSERDPVVARLATSWRMLEEAHDTGLAAEEAGDRDPGYHENVLRPAYDDFDALLDDADEIFADRTVATANSSDLGFWACLLAAWAAIGLLSWRFEHNRRRVQDEMADSAERFRTLAEAAFEGVAVVREGIVVEASLAFTGLFGRTRDEVLGCEAATLVDNISRDVLGDALLERAYATFEVTGAPGGGRTVALEVRTRPSVYHGQDVTILAIRDVTERNALQERLEYQAMHDSLTGLANRALFADRLEHALARAGRRGTGVAVLFLDLDDFKVVNDSWGHHAGDQLLVGVGERLCATLRPEDTVARLGGDEFGVLIEDVLDEDDVVATVTLIGDVLGSQPVPLSTGHAHVLASVGVAFARPGEVRANDVLRRADLAMYEAKARGNGRYAVFQEGMDVRARDRLELENHLRHAITRGELELYFQSQVDVREARIHGFEALLRWHHPSRGEIEPAQFIPIAEQSGLIVPIGRWVLEQACDHLAAWLETHDRATDLTISVNLSVRQLTEPGIVESVSQVLASSGIPAQQLVLEITESVLLNDNPAVLEALDGLRTLGVRLALDDFGTGYSSLSYLSRFSTDVLKIDKSFIDGLGRSSEGDDIVRTILALAHTLNMTCVAEGVEDPAQRDRLRELGCDFAQGYFFHRPGPAGSVDGLLSAIPITPPEPDRALPEVG